MHKHFTWPRLILLLIAVLSAFPILAQPVDLGSFRVEAEPLDGTGFPNFPNWLISVDRLTLTQLENPNPNFAFSDFEVQSARISADVRVEGGLDDDWIGFAIGFDPGETQDPNTDFLLIDWKQQDQLLDGVQTFQGLAISRVSGIPTLAEYRAHLDDANNPDGGLTELARGAGLGNVGWEFDRTYRFTFEVLPGSLRVFVDGQLEIDLATTVDRGRFACFSHSQPGMSCSNITVEEIAAPTLPLNAWNDESYNFGVEAPGSWLLALDALSAEQKNRNDASVFYSDFIVANDIVIADLLSLDNSEDDFIGFVLGFDPGETQDPNAEYLLIDWKKETQSGQIGGESFTAEAGLAVSRVTGIPSVSELAGHQDLPTSTTGGVVELARGATLGGTGWNTGARYVFTFEATTTSLRIFVEDLTRNDGRQLEFDLQGDFSDIVGRFGCFSNSQPRVECGNVQLIPLD